MKAAAAALNMLTFVVSYRTAAIPAVLGIEYAAAMAEAV
jgi:hypothetical protein